MIIGLLIGFFVFQVLFEKLNKLDIKLINKIQARTRAIKRKKLVQYGIMIIFAGFVWPIMDITGVGYLIQGLVVGMIFACIMFLFEDTRYDHMRNTLR